MHEPRSVGEILDCLDELSRKHARVSLGAIVESFGNRSYGPVLMIPALLDWTPVSGLPGLETVLALMAALVAGEMMFGRKHLWLPGFVTRRGIAGAKLRKAIPRLRGAARFMDRHFHGRLPRLTRPPFSRVAAGLVIVICLAVPPLDPIPFGGTGPLLAVAAFGLALLVRDGALMLAALALCLMGLAFGFSIWAAR